MVNLLDLITLVLMLGQPLSFSSRISREKGQACTMSLSGVHFAILFKRNHFDRHKGDEL
jgi:hypothetical protein